MNNVFNASQIVGKQLVTAQPVQVLKNPNTKDVIRLVPAATDLGTVFSYVTRPDGIYWQFLRNGVPYYVKHFTGAFNLDILKQQGSKDLTTQFQEATAKEQGTLDKVLNTAKFIAIAIAAALLFKNRVKL